MVTIDSTARFPALDKQIILTQTDTTVGFSSQNEQKLIEIKTRVSTKPFIRLYENFAALKAQGVRVPNAQKNRVRRSKKTTFIVKGKSFRVAKLPHNSELLKQLSWQFSTSANESGKSYDFSFCQSKADIIVQSKEGLFEGAPSKLYKINAKKSERLR